MKLNVTDANGQQQTILTTAQESPIDYSGAITSTGVAQKAVDVNLQRSGFVLQNLGTNVMYVNDIGDASAVSGSFRVEPGALFPPYGYPVSTGAISVLGTTGDRYTAREW